MSYSFIDDAAKKIRSLPEGAVQNAAMDALVGFDRFGVASLRAFRRKKDPAMVVTQSTVQWSELSAELQQAFARARRGIFISYRRSDTQHAAGRIHDYLCRHFPPKQVFLDVDRINPGADVAPSIQNALASSRVCLALIGKDWITARDEEGKRRIELPHDYVRTEIRLALTMSVIVLPVLVDNARMPDVRLLPDDIAKLAEKNAAYLRHETFGSDCGRIRSWISDTMHA